MPEGAAPHRARHQGQRCGRRRRAGGRAQHPPAGRPARLVRQPSGARDLAVPDPRPAPQRRGVHLRRAGPGPGDRRREHAPAVHAVRSLPRTRRVVAAARAASRADLASARVEAGPEPAAEAREEGHPGVPDRRLQQPVVPRLDAGRRTCAEAGAVRPEVAGQQGARRRGLPRLLPGDPSRPRQGPRLHLVARRARDPQVRLLRPDRLGAALRPFDSDLQQAAGGEGRPPGRHHVPQAVPHRPPRRGLDVRRDTGSAPR